MGWPFGLITWVKSDGKSVTDQPPPDAGGDNFSGRGFESQVDKDQDTEAEGEVTKEKDRRR